MPYSVDRNAKPGETKPKPAPAPIVKEGDPMKAPVGPPSRRTDPSAGHGVGQGPANSMPIRQQKPQGKKQHVRYQMDSETSKRLRVSGGKRGT